MPTFTVGTPHGSVGGCSEVAASPAAASTSVAAAAMRRCDRVGREQIFFACEFVFINSFRFPFLPKILRRVAKKMQLARELPRIDAEVVAGIADPGNRDQVAFRLCDLCVLRVNYCSLLREERDGAIGVIRHVNGARRVIQRCGVRLAPHSKRHDRGLAVARVGSSAG